ncbi:MAG: zinc ABC transporter substrate-binding protein [Gammaproteobacteria bacterium]|nr:zinc ABC transporter substrate-binding protein [Gammaproteobacteria bacterium]
MLRSLFFGSFLYLFLPLTAVANPPNVAVDIAPVHSLVAQVMAGVGKPDLIIQPGASPHGYSLRPSEARALQSADAVFYVSTELTPWLESPLENLAGAANKLALLEVPGITLHDFREGATFEAHDHEDDEHGHHDEHGHKDEYGHDDEHAHKDEHDHDDEHAHKDEHGHDDEHAHKDEHGHDDEHAHKDEHEHHDEHEHKHEHDDKHAHKDEHGDHDEHHHGEHDPHAWLDPENAKIWLNVIAAELSRIDSANASVYQRNAAAAVEELDTLITVMNDLSKNLAGIKFIVFHDAYQYFEQRFGVQASGAISLGDASDPSPARVKEIRDTVTELGIRCVYTEPQYNPGMVRSVFENTQVTTIGVMDPLGADIEVGTEHYTNLLKALLASLNQCT